MRDKKRVLLRRGLRSGRSESNPILESDRLVNSTNMLTWENVGNH